MAPREHPTSVRLPAHLKRRLQQLAQARRQPVSLLIVFVLEEFVKAEAEKRHETNPY